MPKQVLIVKMSAMGDVLHTLPAISDALKAYPDLQFDWIVEEPFQDIPRLHPGVSRVIGHGRLRWKKRRFAWSTLKEQKRFYHDLRQKRYDAVIDAQGRIKSARVAWLANGPVYGLDRNSATDSETRFFYNHSFVVPRQQNAIERVRQLFALALNYQYEGMPNFGVDKDRLSKAIPEGEGALIFIHGTTWESKHWPEQKWLELLSIARDQGDRVLLPWGNEKEQRRAEALVQKAQWGVVLPRLSIWELAGVISRCKGAVGVDTGLLHLAAAMDVPTVSIFGSTNVKLTGAVGNKTVNLQSSEECSPCLKKECPIANNGNPPCYEHLSPDLIWSTLGELLVAE